MPTSTILSEIDAIFASKPVVAGRSAQTSLNNTGTRKVSKKKIKQQQQKSKISKEIDLTPSSKPTKRSVEESDSYQTIRSSQNHHHNNKKKKKKEASSSLVNEGTDGVEEVFDPSVDIVQSLTLQQPLQQTLIGSNRSSSIKKHIELDDEQELAFRDSRGTQRKKF
ncbi:hypothetical protein CROQUDRAFT_714502 [Cronartium quercuum f. sp. fusiforme G11]|uniref:Uncharacterized protein n=1 Tax=Cronartium quercuum f. sp. fusiforme G11 TaxID=708437 RepID=A0A9P6NM80_9BASI|nr:hypothetical protein CROQUDRAFT_714502 [Cronartium quercuum f. sp. fusiforme G11]